MTLPPFGPGPTAIPPKLPLADGIACCALNGPQTPRPVTGAPRATILPPEFQSTHTLPLPTAIDGWSTLPVPTVTRCTECGTAVGAQDHVDLVDAGVDVDQEQVAERVPGRLSVAARHARSDRAARPGRAGIC